MTTAIAAGLLLGLISSFHCVGMCGPLALSLPLHHYDLGNKVLRILLYNIGRITTYSLMGLLFGLAGRTSYIAGWQQEFSIVSGIIILIMVLHYFFYNKRPQPKVLQRYHIQLQQAIGWWWGQKNLLSFWVVGFLNGLLPCGMVYMAVAGALSYNELAESIAFMACFGAGTLPTMIALSLLGIRVSLGGRNKIKRLLPFLMAAIGLLLILRGLNLGIPFISPVLAGPPGATISCH